MLKMANLLLNIIMIYLVSSGTIIRQPVSGLAVTSKNEDEQGEFGFSASVNVCRHRKHHD